MPPRHLSAICLRAAAGIVCAAVLGGCGERDTTPVAGLEMLALPAGPGSGEPHLATAADGTVFLSWLEPAGGDRHALRFATLRATGWSTARTVAASADWFINWADFPSVVPIGPSRLAAHWLVKRPGGPYAYDVAMAFSEDGGQNWSAPFTPHRDGTPTEHGFVTVFPWDGGAGAVWLDGRNMTGEESRGGGMTLRHATARLDGGLYDETELDGLVCDCCQTDVAIARGTAVAVYRDRSPDEIRDIAVLTNDGSGWSAPRPVAIDDWVMPGCPVNGPAIDARGDDVVIAWFTAADDVPRVQFVRSHDRGQHFGATVEIDRGRPLGRVDVVLRENGEAVVSWLARSAGGEAAIHLRGVSASGQPGPARWMARTSAARASGFPQLAIDGDSLLLAWTDAATPSQVRAARVAW